MCVCVRPCVEGQIDDLRRYLGCIPPGGQNYMVLVEWDVHCVWTDHNPRIQSPDKFG